MGAHREGALAGARGGGANGGRELRHPLPRTLGIRPGARVALLGAPEGARALLEPLPPGARLSARLSPGLDVMVLFADRAAELARRMPRARASMKPDAGLGDTKVCAVDATWSGLRLVIRLRDRP